MRVNHMLLLVWYDTTDSRNFMRMLTAYIKARSHEVQAIRFSQK